MPIHNIVHTEPEEAVSVCWRLREEDSMEAILIGKGKFADDKNPEAWKYREYHVINPQDTTWEQFTKIMQIQRGREFIHKLGAWGIQPIYMYRKLLEKAGFATEFIVRAVLFKKYGHHANWMGNIFKTDESMNQFLDEVSASGGDAEWLAHSAFYKRRSNAQMYQLALDYSVARKTADPYLGFFRGIPGYYEGKAYSKPPRNFDWDDFEAFYTSEWEDRNTNKISRFDDYISNGKAYMTHAGTTAGVYKSTIF